MARILIKRSVTTRASLLLLGSLMVVYLLKDIKVVRKDDNPDLKIRQPTKNNSYVFSWLRCQQNRSVANMTNFNSFPDFMKDFLYYRHCRHFPMLLDLPDKCGGADKSAEVFLLLVIKSSPHNYDRRAILRKTWAEERLQNGVWIRRVFLSGTTDSGFEKERLNKLLELEQREYSDILQWDFTDTFQNLTLKQILFLEWMERNCPNVRFLLNGDDDVFANTDHMVEYLQSLEDNDGSKHLFTGHLNINMGLVREPNKYFVPVQIYEPNIFPPYCSGGGFLLSGYTALVIYNMSQSIDLLPIDDAYMGMCLAKAGLDPTSHIAVKPFGLNIPSRLDGYDPCFYKEVLLVHGFFSVRMYFMWHRIHDPNLKCDVKKMM
ncbi:N-acetyllactosaminide beta-1,3-N-acetylglucosaminyltransferase 3 [Larimichthys crocea]|uniref:N-acetyllactosaminide beta-1,3-N-acetylglucosaminyltransferase 3 n=1 Tax=Larimichthys crocea TaxID=215358 RepID=UPI000F5F643A|nr:N-acetyllactosaminide beta-1,3-N-acetylglucosaminyltransferase 3 [Larimichthys crocea]